jgi:hypothetical protein
MLKVRPVELPKVHPSSDAIRSLGQNETYYEPEFWEFQYNAYRYLRNVDNEALIARHESIVENLTILYTEDRHVIPGQSFLSTWYWFRKEHQTRLRDVSPRHTADCANRPFGSHGVRRAVAATLPELRRRCVSVLENTVSGSNATYRSRMAELCEDV